MNSSELTKKRQNQMLYANYLMQTTLVNAGLQGRVNLESGSGRSFSESTKTKIVDGIAQTTFNEQQQILNNINLQSNANQSDPTPPPITNIDLLIIGDNNIGSSSLPAALETARVDLGFSATLTITTQIASVAYTANNLSNFDIVLLYNGGGQGYPAAFGTNITNYVLNGGHLIMASFLWGNVPAPANLTYGVASTYAYKGTMSLVTTSSVTYPVAHPITNGLGTAMGGSQENIPNPITLTLSPDSTTIAQYGNGTSAIAVRQYGSARLVGFNRYPANLTYASNPNAVKQICNAIYWCLGILS